MSPRVKVPKLYVAPSERRRVRVAPEWDMAGAEFICLAIVRSGGLFWAVIVDEEQKFLDEEDPDLYKAHALIDIDTGLPLTELLDLKP